MSNDELQQLKALAMAATPGPWEFDGIRSDGEYGSDDDGGYGFDSYQVTTNTGACVVDCLNNDVGAVHVENDGRAWGKVAKQDAQYIAAASPDVVLALVAEVEQLRADLATPPVASGALPELPEHGEMGSLIMQNKIHPKYSADQMRAYGQACAAAAAPNAALVAALEALEDVGALEDGLLGDDPKVVKAQKMARAALAQAGEVAK